MVGEENASIPTASQGPGSVNITPEQAWEAWGRFGTQAAAARHLLCSTSWLRRLCVKHREAMGYPREVAPVGAKAPKFITPALKREAELAVQEYGTKSAAARALGIDRATLKRRLAAQPASVKATQAFKAWKDTGSQERGAAQMGISVTSFRRLIAEYRRSTGDYSRPTRIAHKSCVYSSLDDYLADMANNSDSPRVLVYKSISDYVDALEAAKDIAVDAGDDELVEDLLGQILALDAAGF